MLTGGSRQGGLCSQCFSWGEDILRETEENLQDFLFVILIQPLPPASGVKAPFYPLFASLSSFLTWETCILEPESTK